MINLKKIKQSLLGDGESDSNLNRFMKKKQNIMGACALVLLIAITLVLHNLSANKEKHVALSNENEKSIVDGVLSTDFTQKNQLSALEQQQAQMDHIRKDLDSLNKQSAEDKESHKAQKVELMNEIDSILEKRKSADQSQALSQTASLKKADLSSAPGVAPHQNMASEPINRVSRSAPIQDIENIQFHYVKPDLRRTAYSESKSHLRANAKTPKTYVPAGTFARGVLLEGADANASVNAQSDTVGILVRILDGGTLPNGHHSHLKGCFVLASIYGDISSERGEARLTTLSCTRSDGTILEQKVKGYLSFAGKEGIKGHPVMRNGKILMMAGASGMLSGFGSALEQSSQTQSISALGTTTSVAPGDVWKSGAYGGANTAMSQLASYYIQRADQYHPIIEIGSGTVATVIFQSGFSLVDEESNQQEAKTTQQSSGGSAQNSSKEIKDLLREAQSVSSAQSSAPFSNVN